MQEAGPPAFPAGPVMALLAATQTGRGWEGPGARRDGPEEKAPVTMSPPGRTLKMGSSVPPGKSEPSVSATPASKKGQSLAVQSKRPGGSACTQPPVPGSAWQCLHLLKAAGGPDPSCAQGSGLTSATLTAAAGSPGSPGMGQQGQPPLRVLRGPFGKHLGPGTPTVTTVSDGTSVTMGPA